MHGETLKRRYKLCSIVAACVTSCNVCTECWAGTHTTACNTCCHNTAQLTTMYFYWVLLQKCNFSQAQ